MKTKLVCLLFCLGIHNTWAQQNMVTLAGRLVNFSNEVSVEDLSEFQNLTVPAADKLIVPDNSGKFQISFALSAPNYFRIGRNILYLSPGDNLKVYIDKGDPTKSKFSGIGKEANVYLEDTPFPKAGSFLETGKNIQSEPKETLDIIMNEVSIRSKQLAAVKGVSAEFRRLEEARIKADLLNSFSSIATYAKYATDLPYYPTVYAMMFNNVAAKIKNQYQHNFIDASLMKLVVYRDVAKELVNNAPPSAESAKIKDWCTATDLVDKMNHENDKAKLAAFYNSANAIKTPEYQEATKAYLQGLLKFGNGDMAVDFTAVDIDNKKVNLADLKGKVIYVDLWATWCMPCLDEMPKLEELKKKYKNNANVVFVSVSIDDDDLRARWKKNVADRSAKGYQWQINRTKLIAYNVTTIPRTLLIDRDFKMVNMNAPLPSSIDLETAIDKLLK
jgi:thiol-disulfide isomerase/thioredoxin